MQKLHLKCEICRRAIGGAGLPDRQARQRDVNFTQRPFYARVASSFSVVERRVQGAGLMAGVRLSESSGNARKSPDEGECQQDGCVRNRRCLRDVEP